VTKTKTRKPGGTCLFSGGRPAKTHRRPLFGQAQNGLRFSGSNLTVGHVLAPRTGNRASARPWHHDVADPFFPLEGDLMPVRSWARDFPTPHVNQSTLKPIDVLAGSPPGPIRAYYSTGPPSCRKPPHRTEVRWFSSDLLRYFDRTDCPTARAHGRELGNCPVRRCHPLVLQSRHKSTAPEAMIAMENMPRRIAHDKLPFG